MPTWRRPGDGLALAGAVALHLRTRAFDPQVFGGQQEARRRRRRLTSSRFSARFSFISSGSGTRSRLQPARLLGQHDRDAVADRIGEAGLAADQLAGRAVIGPAAPWSPGRPGFPAAADRPRPGLRPQAWFGSGGWLIGPSRLAQVRAQLTVRLGAPSSRSCVPMRSRASRAAKRSAAPGASSSACFSADRTGRPCRAWSPARRPASPRSPTQFASKPRWAK